MRLAALFGWLLLAAAGLADPAILGPDTVEPYKLVRLKAEGLPEKAGALWDVLPVGKVDIATSKDRCCLEFVGPPGVYTVELLVATVGADGVPVLSRVRKAVIVGSPRPEPPKPEPEPGPTPDNPAPIPEPGFRVLMVYETGEVLPPGTSSVMFSKQVRDYLDAKCVAGRDGVTKEWRIWDKDVDTSNETPVWQAAMKRERASVPWIVISNGKTGFEGPLPGNVPDALKLLKKYGGE